MLLIKGLINPARYRWQVRRLLSTEGGLLLCKSTLRGGEDGESMLPLEFIQFVLFTIVDAYLSGVLERLTYSSESVVDSSFTLSNLNMC